MFMYSKKGVSPLIATVLLIAFAISLGAVIMNLGVNLTTTVCDTIEIEVLTINQNPRICLEDNQVRFTINNIGSPISGFRAVAIGNTVIEEDYILDIEKLKSSAHTLSIPESETIDAMKFIPITTQGSDLTFCPDYAIDIEQIPDCS